MVGESPGITVLLQSPKHGVTPVFFAHTQILHLVGHEIIKTVKHNFDATVFSDRNCWCSAFRVVALDCAADLFQESCRRTSAFFVFYFLLEAAVDVIRPEKNKTNLIDARRRGKEHFELSGQ